MCSLFIWLTPFFLTQYTTVALQQPQFVYFPRLEELLFSPWRGGFLFQGPQGDTSYLLGYAHILALIMLCVLILKNKIIKKYKSNSIFWFAACVVFIFLITPYSKFFWGALPFLKPTGSHRLLLLTAFTSSILAGFLSVHMTKKRGLLYLLIGFTIFSTILNWGHRRVIPDINDQALINHVWKSTVEGEGHYYANSRLRDLKHPWFSKLPKNHLEIITGQGEIKEIERTSTEHVYVVSAKTPIVLRENTLYFPGWKVNNNNNAIIINPDKEGVITFALPKGLHSVRITYEDIFVYKFIKTISLVTFVVIVGYLCFSILFRFFRNQ